MGSIVGGIQLLNQIPSISFTVDEDHKLAVTSVIVKSSFMAENTSIGFKKRVQSIASTGLAEKANLFFIKIIFCFYSVLRFDEVHD